MSSPLAHLPEELLEHILELAITPTAPAPHYRPSWHPPPQPHSPSGAPPSAPSAPAPLLVSRTWLRIATPLHYRHVVLRSHRQTRLLARTLADNPALGACVRSLRVEGTFAALPDVVRACPALEAFDMTVDNGAAGAEAGAADETVHRFCSGFRLMPRVKHLVIRKNAYLTQPVPTLVIDELGKAISAGWEQLETVNIAFRYSPSAASNSFVTSLKMAPRLRDVRALLPAVWNTTLLEISANPALERIQLTPTTELVGAHLFLSEARKHPRLIELIRAGTPTMRLRAHTTTVVPSAYAPPPPLPVGVPQIRVPPQSTPRAHAKPEHRRDAHAGIPLLVVPQRHGPAARRMSAV
ncbi:hypothetical protein WOLCODRAFT_92487 [Wolfiporia cocos MD-104 SS10]|uniref:Uncharacterized protein n=1 Tax=Wolfiporia cocos (strain MD-104) TaxID=742152 RepID=A0A2H3JGC2_WOLCO|nr:hypothetical protein WOLCODRAFT_92487 [Wolfiporia cocos MD-104 SS10]